MYRFVICVDVEDAPTLKDAYRKLFRTMKTIDAKDFSWESTDEVFDEDDQLEPARVQQARADVFFEETHGND